METLTRFFRITLILSSISFGAIKYTNPEPDIIIDASNGSQGQSIPMTEIDLDNDGTDDLSFFPEMENIWIGPSNGQAYTLGTKVEVIDSIYGPWQQTLIDTLSLNSKVLINDTNWTGGHAPIEKDGFFDGAGDKYIGIKLRDDDKVGWMKVNVSWPIITVKEYAIEETANKDIVVGDKGNTPINNNNINNYNNTLIHNYNPSIKANSLVINAPKNSNYTIGLFNISGKEIKEIKNISLNKGINKISLGKKAISSSYLLLKITHNNSTFIKGFYSN